MLEKYSQLEDRPFVSVIIPVYNDSERLGRCLDALDRQSYPHQHFEVIVVDNGSDDGIGKQISERDGIIVVEEPTPGSYRARNTGLSIARGEILAFTDSDCIPYPEWIENGVRRILSEPGVGLVAGKIELIFRNPRKLTAVELFETVNAFDQKRKVTEYNHGVTANLFTLRTIVNKVGNFNAALKSGGDVEWGNRVHDHGYRLVYEETASVAHPARSTWTELYKKASRVAGGIYDWKGSRRITVARLIIDTYKLFRYTVGLIKRFSFNQPPSQHFGTWNQKLKYTTAFFFHGATQLCEKIHLKLGGSSKRA